LQKGDPVVVVGRSFMEPYKDKDGNERLSLKVNAYNVGLDLKRRSAKVNRVERSSGSGEREQWSAPAPLDDEPPF
jgi:single-stranded DNA-binding protein